MKFIPEIPIATKALLLHHLHKNNAILEINNIYLEPAKTSRFGQVYKSANLQICCIHFLRSTYALIRPGILVLSLIVKLIQIK